MKGGFRKLDTPRGRYWFRVNAPISMSASSVTIVGVSGRRVEVSVEDVTGREWRDHERGEWDTRVPEGTITPGDVRRYVDRINAAGENL